nr:GAF domain-containing protein [Bacteroidota bacterium]
ITVIDNPLSDPCVLNNPLVTGQFGLKFYAGAPIITPDGFVIGTLCIIDKKQRYINEDQKVILAEIASIVMDYVTLRLKGTGDVENNARAQDTACFLQ